MNRTLICGDNAADMAAVLKAAWWGVKAGRPAVPVVMPSLAFCPSKYALEFANNGLASWTDGWNCHFYGWAADFPDFLANTAAFAATWSGDGPSGSPKSASLIASKGGRTVRVFSPARQRFMNVSWWNPGLAVSIGTWCSVSPNRRTAVWTLGSATQQERQDQPCGHSFAWLNSFPQPGRLDGAL